VPDEFDTDTTVPLAVESFWALRPVVVAGAPMGTSLGVVVIGGTVVVVVVVVGVAVVVGGAVVVDGVDVVVAITAVLEVAVFGVAGDEVGAVVDVVVVDVGSVTAGAGAANAFGLEAFTNVELPLHVSEEKRMTVVVLVILKAA